MTRIGFPNGRCRTRRAGLRAGVAVGLCIGVLGGCSSVPDAVNPIEWYRGTRDWVTGAGEPETKADAAKARPSEAASKDFPKLDTVPERPPQAVAEDRKRLANSLAADRESARYSDEVIRRQTDIGGAMAPAAAAEPSPRAEQIATAAPERPARAPPRRGPPATASRAPPAMRGTTEVVTLPPMQAAPPAPPEGMQSVPPAPAEPLAVAVQNEPLTPALPDVPPMAEPPSAPPPAATPPPMPMPAPTMPQTARLPSAPPLPPAMPTRRVGQTVRPVPSGQPIAPLADPSPAGSAFPQGPLVFGPPPDDIAINSARPAEPAPSFGPAAVSPSFGTLSSPAAVAPSFGSLSPPAEAPGAGVIAAAPATEPDGESLATIGFASGSARIDAAAQAEIGRVARTIRARRLRVRVVGHSSSRTRDLDPVRHQLANFRVSLDRANAVARELARRGVDPDLITVNAVSDSEPAFYEVMPAGEAGNRRVVILIDN